ncbi:MAG: hypothetical protein VB024_11105 [Dysgonamonadaceae bacterium]|jgi:hypothetical protein|nr:hypothetical protein [Dysgonamonadaceae bacterium]MDD3309027.1 hypothetical protein [Dysgonamonadaceae bacterium]MDD3900967.1 hypothetical protein [Dysgonamonadaceae bacterium]MDD4399388.1 hypothetical protein [Dysgonamonadaceae bacterium]MEA5082152.1 hypothetical protein [Dysgonamonadaceae bacterium]
MLLIYTKHIPFKGFRAINLFGIVFARKEFFPLSKKVLYHESIHTCQIKEMLFVFFYVWYLLEWLIRLFIYKNGITAYRNISFEREAYENDKNKDYLNNRKSWMFLNYLG